MKPEIKNKGKQVPKGMELLKEGILKEAEGMVLEAAEELMTISKESLETVIAGYNKNFKGLDERVGLVEKEVEQLQTQMSNVSTLTFMLAIGTAKKNRPDMVSDIRSILVKLLPVDLDGATKAMERVQKKRALDGADDISKEVKDILKPLFPGTA